MGIVESVNCYPTAELRMCLTVCFDSLGGRIYNLVDNKVKQFILP